MECETIKEPWNTESLGPIRDLQFSEVAEGLLGAWLVELEGNVLLEALYTTWQI